MKGNVSGDAMMNAKPFFLGDVRYRLFSSAGLLALLALLLVGVTALPMLGQWRMDLTRDKLYTLSNGTKNILAGIQQPITLKFYYSESLSRDVPALRTYARRVDDMLREYERAAQGKIRLEKIHPEPFSEEEDEAAAAGLQALPNGQGDAIYLGLAGYAPDDKLGNIMFFNPQREGFLEYDLSQMIYRLSQSTTVTAGVMSGLPVFRSMDYKSNSVRPAWAITGQLQQLFDIRRQIDTNIDKIDDDLNLLIVIHPHMLPEKALYAIDQFVLRGGKLLVFVDPVAEMDDSEKLLGAGFADKSSNLEQLFDAWGVNYDPAKVVLDMTYAHSIPVTQYGREMPHVGVLGLTGTAINHEQNMVAQLDGINISSAGGLLPKAGATTQFVPLLSSGNKTELMDAGQYSAIGNHADLMRQFQPQEQVYHFAAVITGAAKTAFPTDKLAPAQLMEAPSIHVIVVADTDMLSDRMWVETQDFYGTKQLMPFAANGDFVVNMVDALGGSADLASLRSRGTYQRPFTRVDDLEKAASSQLREQENALMTALSDTEKQISLLNKSVEIDSESGDVASVTAAVAAEQKSAVAKFQEEKLRIRKNLREVQRQLNSDVEQLGVLLKVINIAAVPALLIVLALVLSGMRARRARRA